jgi:hypothetical protein
MNSVDPHHWLFQTLIHIAHVGWQPIPSAYGLEVRIGCQRLPATNFVA